MRIRKATIKDAKIILKLLKNTREFHGLDEGDPVYTKGYVEDCIKDRKMNLVFVMEEKKKIIGFLNVEMWKKKKFAFLMNFMILQGYRKKGLATKLYKFFEQYCKKEGINTIGTLVQMDNKRMQKFCSKIKLKKGHKMYFYEKEI